MMMHPKSPFVERGEQGINFERIVFFSDAVFAIAITLLALETRWYASHNQRLTTPDIEPSTIRYVFYRSAATIGVSLLATGVAFMNTIAALIVLGSYAILAIIIR